MTLEEKKSEVSQWLMAQGLLDKVDCDNKVKELAAACPAAQVQALGLTDDYEKAWETIQIQKGKASEVPGGAAAAATAVTPATGMPAAPITAQQQRVIAEGLVTTKATRIETSSNTVIETLVYDKPAPAELIQQGTKGVIKKEVWDNILKKYDGKVLADDTDVDGIKSTTNFNLLKAAAEAGTPVEVYIGAQSSRPIAANVQVADGTGKKTIPMGLTQLENFVTLQTYGYVLATDHTAGVMIRYIKPKKDPKNPNTIKPGRTVLTWKNKSKATWECSREVTNEVKQDAACKSALCFRVDTGKKRKDGRTPILQTVRVTVHAPVKITKRKPQYNFLGDIGKGAAGDLLTAPDAKMMKSINEAQVAKIAELQAKLAQGDFETITEYGDQLKAFGTVPSNPAAAANVAI